MYPQVQASNNTLMYIGLAVLALLIVGGILLYVFVFKCKEDGGECTETSDCCEGLECIDSICSSSSPSITPTVTPRPVVAANVVVSDPDPGPELITCADWDITNNCATETTLTPGTVIGNSQNECCVSALDCQGTWSACTSDCERTFTETQAQFGTGAACPTDAEAPACQPGEGECPPNIDCGGYWGACTSDCERTFTVTTPQSGTGDACPTNAEAPACQPGEGECPQNCILSEWTEYGGCSTRCGPGIMTRTRTIIQQAINGGRPCSQYQLLQSADCVGTECDVTGTWIVAEPNEDCINACNRIGDRCEDGNWEIDGDITMRAAIDAAGEDSSAECGDDTIRTASTIPGAPYITSDGLCIIRHSFDTYTGWTSASFEDLGPESANMGVANQVSTCAAKAWDHRRLCKCVPP